MIRPSCVVLLLLLSGPASAAECTRHDLDAVDAALDHLKSWSSIADAYRRFHKCIDEYISEGFSESIARMFADHWQQVAELIALGRKTPGLETFVVKHLDETINLADAQKISDLARHSCPKGAKSLCRRIDAQLGDPANVVAVDAT